MIYPSRRTPAYGDAMVAASHPRAAQAGLLMLKRGGSAVDAALAAAAVMTLVEPCSNGLGGDAFGLWWDGQALRGLNASGWAPASWQATPPGQKREALPRRGWGGITVPGMIGGWWALHQRGGQLPWAEVLAPAIEVAEDGHAVGAIVAHKWALAVADGSLAAQPGFAEAFLPQGRAPRAGERFALPGAARLLRALAAQGVEAFYSGEIAAALLQAAQAAGAGWTATDLAQWAPEWVTPIDTEYFGHRLCQIPPNGQGIATLMAAGLLRECPGALELLSGPQAATSVAAAHLQIEAIKLAFADLYAQVAEPAAMRVSVEALLSPERLRARARLIDPKRAAQAPAPDAFAQGGTIYLCAADAQGRMVSWIQSNFHGFGSGVVLPQWGLALHNRGCGFVRQAGHPNDVGPRKRPMHTIIPGFLLRGAEPCAAFGVMGADMQPQGQLQVATRLLAQGHDPQAALDAPRWRVLPDGGLALEPAFDAQVAAGLAALGHRIGGPSDPLQDFGAGQVIARATVGPPGTAFEARGYVGGTEWRRDGLVAAW